MSSHHDSHDRLYDYGRSDAPAEVRQALGRIEQRLTAIEERLGLVREDGEMKDPKHDGGSSITQDSVNPSRDGAGRTPSPYKSGANVHKGGGPGPSKPAPASQPKEQTY